MYHLESLKEFNDELNNFWGIICTLIFAVVLSNHAVTPAFLRASSPDLVYKYWYKLVTIAMHLITWTFACEYYRKVLLFRINVARCKLLSEVKCILKINRFRFAFANG